jgi:hypothetical protein
MTAPGGPGARGRPPGPSLAKDAASILNRNAFSALRGPNSRGAVPRSSFVDIDTSTVDRSVKRELGSTPGKTPFDLASRHLCSTETDEIRSTLLAIFAAVDQSFRETDDVRSTLRVFLEMNFVGVCQQEDFLGAILVQTAACAHIENQSGSSAPEQTAAAREVIEGRRQLYELFTNEFGAGLAVALRRLRRRPRSNFSVHDIVVAIHSALDGLVLRHHLDPDLFDAELAVEAQWSIAWGMTEPGLLDPPDHSRPVERELVEEALAIFASGHVPSLEQLVQRNGAAPDLVSELFPSIEALAQRCMDFAVGSSSEIRNIANNFKGAEIPAIRNLLIATTQQATDTPVLIDVLRQHKEQGFCAEARRHLAEALVRSEQVQLDRSTADKVALMLLEAALQGETGQPIWANGLDSFISQP